MKTFHSHYLHPLVNLKTQYYFLHKVVETRTVMYVRYKLCLQPIYALEQDFTELHAEEHNVS